MASWRTRAGSRAKNCWTARSACRRRYRFRGASSTVGCSMPRSLPAWTLLMLVACALPARADIRISIEGVDGEERRNVETRLSVSRLRDNKDIDEDTMRRLALRVDGEARSGLVPFGYYEPTVTSNYRAVGKDWQVSIKID